MKYLIDAQLPRQATAWFSEAGSDAIHSLDLPDGNRTTDDRIIQQADRDGRVVVTKDADFVDAHLITGRPARLLLISTGNITNAELESLLKPLTPTLHRAFTTHRFIELGRDGLITRD